MSLRSGVRIDALSEHKETVIQKFQNEVAGHIDQGDENSGPSESLSKVIAADGRDRCEYGVESRHFQHGDRYIIRRLESKLSVESKVPQYRCYKGNQVTGPVRPFCKMIQQRIQSDLNQTC